MVTPAGQTISSEYQAWAKAYSDGPSRADVLLMGKSDWKAYTDSQTHKQGWEIKKHKTGGE